METTNWSLEIAGFGKTEISVQIAENPASTGQTILCVPGMCHTAATFQPLARALLAASELRIARVVMLDLPGHGRSGLPPGMQLSDVSLECNASTLIAVLEQLRVEGRAADLVLGHSLGGTVVAYAQERLLHDARSYRETYGIHTAILVAPDPSKETPWALADSGATGPIVAQFVVDHPDAGKVVAFPAAAWPALFFANKSGAVVRGAPTKEEVSENGYVSFESLFATQQLCGIEGQSRVSLRANAFGSALGTQLILVSLSEDGFLQESEHRAMIQHLTGSTEGLVSIANPNAVHDMHVSDPADFVRLALSLRTR